MARTAHPITRFKRVAIELAGAAVFSVSTMKRERPSAGSLPPTVTDFGVMRVLNFTDPDGLDVEIAHWVGGSGPTEVDMSRATDKELLRRRVEAANASE